MKKWDRLTDKGRLSISVLCLTVLAAPAVVPLAPPAEPLARAERLGPPLVVVRTNGAEAPIPEDEWYLLAPKGKVLEWFHPLAGERELPDKVTRQFGALRPREPRSECGLGHCGVDLGGTVGTPVLAVQAGVVVKVNADPTRSGGRYVVVRHDNGFESEYMHLDRVNVGLKRDMKIAGGTFLGTLGTSGIHHSQPHLHFAISRKARGGERRYVDPEPMLNYARLSHEEALTGERVATR